MRHSELARVIAEGYWRQSGHSWGVEWYVKDVRAEHGCVAITFRGTETSAGGWTALRDWLRNLLTAPYCTKRTPCGHLGWIRAAERALAAGLALDLHREYGRDTAYRVGGHSGGVESHAFAEILYMMGFNVVEWVGIGTPKMWLTDEKPDFPCTQYAFDDDIVTKMAPFLKRRGDFVRFPAEDWWPSFRRHGLEHYVPAIRRHERQAGAA